MTGSAPAFPPASSRRFSRSIPAPSTGTRVVSAPCGTHRSTEPGSSRCAEREGLLHRGVAARLRHGARGRWRWTVQEQHARLRLGAAGADGCARCLGSRRHGAAAQPASETRRRHDGSAPQAQVPGDPRRAVADSRARRLSMGRRHSRSALPFLLSQVDADGNEIGGIRLPEQEVPLGDDDRLAVPKRADRRSRHADGQQWRVHPVPGDARRA